jgi:hypothetical protein
MARIDSGPLSKSGIDLDVTIHAMGIKFGNENAYVARIRKKSFEKSVVDLCTLMDNIF